MQICGRIDRVGRYLGLDQTHAPAVLDETQHVDRFRDLEWSRRKPRKLLQSRSPERNHAHLLEETRSRLFKPAAVRDRRARKVKRVTLQIGHNLDRWDR